MMTERRYVAVGSKIAIGSPQKLLTTHEIASGRMVIKFTPTEQNADEQILT